MTGDPITFTNWWDTIVLAVGDAWIKILGFIPNLVGAFAVILIGLLVAYVVKWALFQIFAAIRLDKFSDKVKLTDVLAKTGVKQSLSELLSNLFKWIIIIVFLMPAMEILGLSQVGDVLNQVLGYIPKAVIAGFLVFVGIIVADVVAHVIKATAVSIGASTANILASVARYSVYVFVGLMALVQLGVATNLLLSLFTGVVAMVAIAGGLAFGLGGKDAAADLIKKIREDFSKKQ